MLSGYSTKDALRILDSELESTLQRYESDIRHRSWRKYWEKLFLHHSNKNTVFHWPSALLILLSAIFLFLSCAFQPGQ